MLQKKVQATWKHDPLRLQQAEAAGEQEAKLLMGEP